MTKIAYVTVSDNAYAAQVYALGKSLSDVGVERLYWLVLDQDYFRLHEIRRGSASSLDHSFEAETDRYSTLELCTKVRPSILRRVLELSQAEIVCYVDPDVYVYKSLNTVVERAPTSSIWLSPHLLPEDLENALGHASSKRFIEQANALQRWGAHNMGIYFVRGDDVGYRFLDIYDNFLQRSCSELSIFGFVDQKWLDVLYLLFKDSISIIAHPGVNLGYWNQPFRLLEKSSESILVNGSELCAIHFSGVNIRRISAVYAENGLFYNLAQAYQRELTFLHQKIPSNSEPLWSGVFKFSRFVKILRRMAFYFLMKTEY